MVLCPQKVEFNRSTDAFSTLNGIHTAVFKVLKPSELLHGQSRLLRENIFAADSVRSINRFS